MLQPFRLTRAETLEDPSVTSPSERRRLFGQRDHVRVYGRDVVARLQAVGFDVQLEQYLEHIPEDDIRRYGLMKEPIFVCSKSTLS